MTPPNATPQEPHDASLRLAGRQTGLSLHRTHFSADRTLMAVIRTSLSLISFGFTIFQFFRAVHHASKHTSLLGHTVPLDAAQSFSLALMVIGVVLLCLGLAHHVQFMRALRAERQALIDEGFVPGEVPFLTSVSRVGAIALLLLGATGIAGILFRVGPFD